LASEPARSLRVDVSTAGLNDSFEALKSHRRKTALGVRRDKAALFQWVQAPPGNRSSRKQPEQLWR
jgi:hypothetical protein